MGMVPPAGAAGGKIFVAAREYEVPAAGVKDATRTIRNGQLIGINGKAGTVVIFNHQSND